MANGVNADAALFQGLSGGPQSNVPIASIRVFIKLAFHSFIIWNSLNQ